MKHFEIKEVVRHSPKEVWRLYAKNFQYTFPKAIPQHYTSCEYLDGPPLAAGGIFQLNYNNETFCHFEYLKAVWDYVEHDKMQIKCTVFEGGYLGKHTNPNMSYSTQVLDGDEPNTSIIKWIIEYDENFGDAIQEYVKEEARILATYLESHITEVNRK